MRISELIKELQKLHEKYGDVLVESFFEGMTGGMNIHYEPAHPPKMRGKFVVEDGEEATVYLGETWY
jgi:hypothetical protein